MSKILSQEEIDLLLSAAADAKVRTPERVAASGPVIRYNFRRPDRVSKEQIHSLHFLHDRFARTVATSLSAYLRTITELSVVSVEQFSYSEYLMALSDPTAFYSLSIKPFDTLGALEVNPAIAFAMIDRMLGGAGRPLSLARALTEIEQNVLDSVVKILLDGLTEGWRPIVQLAFGIQGHETRPRMLQVVSLNEVVVMVVFEAKIGEATGMLNLCIPASIVENTASQFVQAWHPQQRDVSGDEVQWLAENLGRMPVRAMPVIETRVTGADVLSFQAGDIVSLGVATDERIEVRVGPVRKLRGRLAAENARLMFRVDECCGPGLARAD